MGSISRVSIRYQNLEDAISKSNLPVFALSWMEKCLF
jgi:hypothetical protein